MFGEPKLWRAGGGEGARESLSIKTLEDVREGRDSPFPHAQLAPAQVCLSRGRKRAPLRVILRTVPKSGSQSLSKLLWAWPGIVTCPENDHGGVGLLHRVEEAHSGHALYRPEAPRPLVFAFVRHPFSRLVSGFHTIMLSLSRLRPGTALWKVHGQGSALALLDLPFWKAFVALEKDILSLTKDEICSLFSLFVSNVIGSVSGDGHRNGTFLESAPRPIWLSAQIRGRNGLAPILHHVFSQTYFLGLKMNATAGLCAEDQKACSPRLEFVGRLEEAEAHLAAMVDHFSLRNDSTSRGRFGGAFDLVRGALRSQGQNESAHLRKAAGRDTLAHRFVDEGGKLFEEALVPSNLNRSIMTAIKDYYAQDMACLGSALGYTWGKIERPGWHADPEALAESSIAALREARHREKQERWRLFVEMYMLVMSRVVKWAIGALALLGVFMKLATGGCSWQTQRPRHRPGGRSGKEK